MELKVADLELNVLKQLDRYSYLEEIINNLELQTTQLNNELTERKSFSKLLAQDLNYNRDDLRTFINIQRDYETESYIKQLEDSIELIMSKYRQQIQHKIDQTSLDFNDAITRIEKCKCTGLIEKQSAIINGLTKMMNEFMVDGEKLTNTLLIENQRLKTENKELRQIVEISNTFYFVEDEDNNNEVNK